MSCFDTGSRVMVGGLSRQRLLAALDSAEVRLNDHARVLIAGPPLDRRDPEPIRVITRGLSTLGLTSGGTLRQIFSTAESRGLHPCPPDSGPYLRIAWLSQPQSHDSVQSTGRAPAGAVTIASEPIDETFATPKGSIFASSMAKHGRALIDVTRRSSSQPMTSSHSEPIDIGVERRSNRSGPGRSACRSVRVARRVP